MSADEPAAGSPGATPAALRAASLLLDEVLDLPPPARQAWLDRLASRDPVQHPMLVRLMALHAASDATALRLDLPAAALWLAGATSGPSRDGLVPIGLQPGHRVGPYRLLRELGSGGMAEVWLASRDDGAFARQVALKLPRLSRLRPDLAERFARERDILARLEYPHIARFYDAGVSSDGLPYLAMEFVEGLTITAYADHHRLPIRARIRLCQQVVEAIQHAHANLVIHRDLKPSNILVNAQGQVRVLDFGIAKLVDGDEPAAASPLTQQAGRALTVAYASPEQVRGEALSTASDVYSLGVVLYELLTGCRPYRLSTQTPAQLEAAILDVEPVRASEATGHGSDAGARALQRDSTPTALQRTLDGDLDAVLGKALAKSIADRYDGCAALRADLQRWLEGQPVLARAPSLAYQVRKFIGRNKLAAAWASGLLLALVGGAALALWQAGVAREQARLAHHQEQKARAVQDFLLGLFRANAEAQPDPLKARQATARELLDIGAARVRDQLAGSPEVQEAVLQTLAQMYGDVGLDKEAADLEAQRVAVRMRLYGPADVRVAEALIDHASAVNSTPQAALAPELLRHAERIVDQAPGEQATLRLRILFGLSQVNRYANVSAAFSYAQQAQALIERSAAGPGSLRRALYLQSLTLGYLGACGDARELARRAHQLTLAASGTQARWQIPELTAISAQSQCLGDLVAAESALRQALAVSTRVNGSDHIDTAHVETRLARVLADSSRFDEARRLDDRLAGLLDLRVVRENLNLHTALLHSLAIRDLDSGRLADADRLLADLVPQVQGFTGEGRFLSVVMHLRGRALAALGRHAEAATVLDQTLAMRRRVLGERAQPVTWAAIQVDRADLLLAAADPTGALALLAEVERATPATVAEMRPVWPVLARVRAGALRELGRGDEAAAVAEAGLAYLQTAVREVDWPRLRADLSFELGLARLQHGHAVDARDALQQARALRLADDDRQSPWLAQTELALADASWALGEPAAARAQAQTALARLQGQAELDPRILAASARWQQRLNRPPKAVDQTRRGAALQGPGRAAAASTPWPIRRRA